MRICEQVRVLSEEGVLRVVAVTQSAACYPHVKVSCVTCFVCGCTGTQPNRTIAAEVTGAGTRAVIMTETAETGKAADTVTVTVIMTGNLTGTSDKETAGTDTQSVSHAVVLELVVEQP